MARESGLRVPPLLLLVLLVGLVVGVERLVVTDAEAVEGVVDRAVQAVRRKDWASLRALLSAAYRGEGGDADGAVARARSAWREYEPHGLSATVLDVRVDVDRASAPTNVRARLLGRAVAVRLELGLVREEDGWKVASAVLADVTPPR